LFDKTVEIARPRYNAHIELQLLFDPTKCIFIVLQLGSTQPNNCTSGPPAEGVIDFITEPEWFTNNMHGPTLLYFAGPAT